MTSQCCSNRLTGLPFLPLGVQEFVVVLTMLQPHRLQAQLVPRLYSLIDSSQLNLLSRSKSHSNADAVLPRPVESVVRWFAHCGLLSTTRLRRQVVREVALCGQCRLIRYGKRRRPPPPLLQWLLLRCSGQPGTSRWTIYSAAVATTDCPPWLTERSAVYSLWRMAYSTGIRFVRATPVVCGGSAVRCIAAFVPMCVVCAA